MTVDIATVGATVPGHRERSKAKRHRLVLESALELFAEQGFDATTIAQIAERAEVAPRTVHGYFPAKIDLATAVPDQCAASITQILRDHPDVSLADAIGLWLEPSAEYLDLDLIRLVMRAFAANPALRGLSTATLNEALDEGLSRLAMEMHRPADDPLVAMVSACASASLSSAISAVADGADQESMRHEVTRLLAVLTRTVGARP